MASGGCDTIFSISVLASLVQLLVLSALRVAFTGLFKRVEGEAPDPTEPGWNSGGADAYGISRPIWGPQSLLIVDLFIATIAKMVIDAIKRTRATALAIYKNAAQRKSTHKRQG